MSERVELDRLADYAAGLLDGTPQGEAVARLIATDPAWAEAYAQLTEADLRVRGDLAALRTDEPVPAEVVARLEAALDAAGSGAGRKVLSLDAARRRRRRWAAAAAATAAAAAGVAAFGMFGLPALRGTDSGGFTAVTADGAGAPERAPAASSTDSVGAPRILASGTDYRRETLRMAVAALSAKAADAASQQGLGTTADRPRGLGGSQALAAAPAELRRLVEHRALDACLTTIVTAYGGRVASVDFARFEGTPGLVVHLVQTDPAPARVVVAGPDCGLPGSGPDVRYTTTLE